MKTVKKITKALCCVTFIVFLAFPYRALAIDIPTPTEAFREIIGLLGIQESELRANAQVINYDRYKKQAPEVDLTFDPVNPVIGQKIAAVATPSYFLNDSKNNYFTWFLKTADCTGIEDNNYHYKKDCDLNNDHKVNIEDYKIKAMRILASNDYNWSNESYHSDSDDDGFNAIVGGSDQAKKKRYCFVRNVRTGLDIQLKNESGRGDGCGHFFPDAPGHKTGDGSFGADEEKFWHTNPNNPDTAGSGNGDEANVVGLGMDTFSWNYNSGDQVGVVVEGVSVDPVETQNSSFKTMWATPKPLYGVSTKIKEGTDTNSTNEVSDDSDKNTRTTTTTTTTRVTEFNEDNTKATITTTVSVHVVVTELIGDQKVISDTTTNYDPEVSVEDLSDDVPFSSVKDLNQLLYKTLVDPQEGGAAKGAKLNVELSYTPDSPMNDSSAEGSDGDYIFLSAGVNNALDPDYDNYTWQVFSSDQLNPADWGDPLLKSKLVDSTQTTGVGLNTFSFKLNFPHPKKYLRVKLTVTENVFGNKTREGHTDVVIPIYSSSQKIQALNTAITDNTSGPILSTGDTELCKEGIDRTICPVSKDQIIALKVPAGLVDYSWTIDGEPFQYKKCFFDGCNENKQTNVAFFPALEDAGYQYTVNLTATDVKTGQKVNLTRNFQVVEPQVKVASVDLDTCSPTLLGNYVDVDGKDWPDYSEQNFQSTAGMPMRFKADFIGGLPSSGNYVWYVDGLPVTADNAKFYGYDFDEENNLMLPGKPAGENYDVSIAAVYAPDNLTKKALNAYWDVSYGEFYEENVSNSINVDSMGDVAGMIGSAKGKNKIYASVLSSMPNYLAFLFRIVLTGFVLLVIPGFVFSLFPNIKRNE